MLLVPIKTDAGQGGRMAGTGTFKLEGSPILGGVNISADSSNVAVVTVRKDDANGDIIFDQSTKSPLFVSAPFLATKVCYFSITGVNAEAQFYQWQE